MRGHVTRTSLGLRAPTVPRHQPRPLVTAHAARTDRAYSVIGTGYRPDPGKVACHEGGY